MIERVTARSIITHRKEVETMLIVAPPEPVKTLPDPVRTEFIRKLKEWTKVAFSGRTHFIQIPDYPEKQMYVNPNAVLLE